MGGWNLFHDVFNTGDPFDTTGHDTNRQTGFQQNPTGNSFDLGKSLGVVPNYIDPSSPGGSVDTSGADAQRQQTEALINALQQQAATGNGAWQSTFKNSVDQAKNNASGLGQSERSQAQGGYSGALRNIGNAQGAIGQRAVGQEKVLRQESMNDAQNQLGQLESNVGAGDISQAANVAAVQQQSRLANLALQQQASQNQDNMTQGVSKLAGPFSKGGTVPGKPRVFGDSERNDTVPAMLSPGEIVVPRTKAHDPRAAAEFARQVAMRHGKHLAGGGTPDSPDTGTQVGLGLLSTFLPFAGTAARQAWMQGHGVGQSDPNTQNGGMLDTTNYQQTSGQMNTLAGQLGARANGDNSIAGTISQQQSDNAMQAAIQQQNAKHAVMSNLLQENAKHGANIAGEAGAKAGNEQSAGQNALGHLTEQRRAQEMALAEAQQKAGWTNTQINSGISLQNQAALRNALSAAGQASAGYMQLGGRDAGGHPEGGGGDPYGDPSSGQTNDLGDQTPPDEGGGGDEPGSGAIPTNDQPEGAAHGGVIGHLSKMKSDYDAALAQRFGESARRMADGGVLSEANVPSEGGVGPSLQRINSMRQGRAARAIAPLPQEPSTASKFVDLVKRGASQAAGKATAAMGLADGGEVSGAGGGMQDDGSGGSRPDVLPPRRDNGPTVYLSTTPTPGSVPVQSGAGGGAPDTGAGGGPGWYGPGTISRPDLGSGGASGGPSGNQTPINEETAMQANAATAPTPVKLPPGVVPRGQEVVPAPSPKPIARTGGAPERPVDTSSFDEEKNINRALAETESEKAKAEAGAQFAAGQRLEELQRDEQRRRAQAQEDGSAMMSRYNQALDEMKKIDTSVDPNHYWASRSTGQKIMGIIGLALGAVGSNDGTNKAAQMLGQAIDRDVEAQKAEANARLKKGESALAGAQTAYGMHRQMFQDDLAATAAAKATSIELAQNKLAQITSTYASPEAKQKGALLNTQLEQSKQKFIQEAQTHSVDNAYKKAETYKAYKEGDKAGAGPAIKNNELEKGAEEAINDLERELKTNPTSPRISQLRASVLLHMNKLQGGRFNEEINKMNQALVPGNEGLSLSTRIAEQIAPGLMNNNFQTLRKHIAATANTPPNPAYAGEP